MSAKKTQVLLIAGALILFVLLFIAPTAKPPDQHGESTGGVSGQSEIANANVEIYLNTAVKKLASENKQRYEKLLASGNADSLALFWDKQKRPDLAAWFVESSAKKKNDAEAWMKAGNRYYYAVQFTSDQTEVPVLYQSATRCFAKAVELDPGNTDARIMLASCYVEGSADPMKGISQLREIEKTDSNNVKLQLSFAFFSLKSRQLDKAIARFNKVLQIDSNYIEAYLHLADAYEQQEDKEKTILMLERYAARTQDMTARMEIKNYIKQLKK